MEKQKNESVVIGIRVTKKQQEELLKKATEEKRSLANYIKKILF
jgi:hypothetical protein